MGGYYRLKDLGYRLPAGFHILDPKTCGSLSSATDIIADAEAKAEEMKAAAEEAYLNECARGYEDGLAQARMLEIERLLGESNALDETLHGIGNDLTTIVVTAVRKLTQNFDDFARAEAVVRGALTQMRREKRAELRISPQQHAEFRRAVDGIKSDFAEVERIDVVEDSTLSPPHVVVETSIGRVDGEFGNNLAELAGILHTVFGTDAELDASPGVADAPADDDLPPLVEEDDPRPYFASDEPFSLEDQQLSSSSAARDLRDEELP